MASVTKSIFTTQVPSTLNEVDGSIENLGTAFFSDVAGQVTGIRFYTAAVKADGRPVTVGLFTKTGTLLGSRTLTQAVTVDGWVTVPFSAPVTIAAGATYIATLLAPQTSYAATSGFFSTAVDNAPLHAFADTAAQHNGLFHTASTLTLPDQTFGSACYFVDPVFVYDDGASGGAPTVSVWDGSASVAASVTVGPTSIPATVEVV